MERNKSGFIMGTNPNLKKNNHAWYAAIRGPASAVVVLLVGAVLWPQSSTEDALNEP